MRPLHQMKPPIAMLHAVSDSPDESFEDWCLSRNAFSRLLDAVEAAQLTTTHFAERIEKPRPAAQTVILTFDDCYRHLFDFAVPELVKRGMKAAFYMPTAYFGGFNVWDTPKGAPRMELMNESEVRDLVRLGMEVGSHSHRHVELKPLSGTPALQAELTTSKTVLEAVTGRPVYSFAYPFGSVPTGYRTALTAAGYRYAVGIYHPFETALALRRFGVYEKDTTDSLRRKLSRRYRWMRSLYDAVKKY